MAHTHHFRAFCRWLAISLVLTCVGAQAHAASTLEKVRQRGSLLCGVSTGVAGFSAMDRDGHWHGLDVDICKAIAAAALGSADRVQFVPLNSQQRFVGLQSGQVDLLSRNTSWTLTRDASIGLSFTAITFYDGQGFLVPTKLHIRHVEQLKGAQVCVQSGTTTEKNLSDFARAHRIELHPVVFENYQAAFKALFSGRCQAYTSDASSLASVRNHEAPRAADYVVLDELISKEPLGPFVRRGDEAWLDVVRWVVFALQEAEEHGITQANLAQMAQSDDPAIRRLLGNGEDSGRLLGLEPQWAAHAIAAVGNYGEIFERNVGSASELKLARGPNRLWSQGGLVYPAPLR